MMKEQSKYLDLLKMLYFLLTFLDPIIIFRDFKMEFKVVIYIVHNNLNENHLSCLSNIYIQGSKYLDAAVVTLINPTAE